MTRKRESFQELLEYINKGKQRENTPIFHNLKTDPDDFVKIADEFKENAQYCPPRKNGVVLYHEMISFSGKDLAKISPEMLADLGREYLRIRAPEALGYAKAHLDTDNPHIHFCISGNKIKQRKKNRLSKAGFDRVKRKMERYRAKQYPELVHSAPKRRSPRLDPCHRASRAAVSSHISRKEREQRRRVAETKRTTVKQDLAKKISDIFRSVSCLSDGLERLDSTGLSPYSRGKNTFYGVQFKGRKYRLSTLGVRGLVDDRVRHWERVKKRLSELEAIGRTKDRQRQREADKSRCK